MDTTTTKDKLAKFGRALALLLNRGMMYQKSHPMVKEAINEVHKTAELIFAKISPLVFILNRDQFFVDEEQLDPRINARRIATLFKNHKIQSVSFENGVSHSELDIFIDLFSSMTMSTDAESLKKTLFSRGVFHIKINHVLYKKVTEDDQIISREALKDVTPALEAEDSQSRKKFMDTLLETILTEEFANTLNIRSLLANPKMVSRNMIKADLASAQKLGNDQSETQGRDSRRTDVDSGGGSGSGGPGMATGPGQGAGAGAGSGAHEASAPGTAAGSGTGSMVGISATMADPESALGGATPGADTGAATKISRSISGQTGGPGGGADGIETGGHGPMLLHQLELIQREVQKQLEDEGDTSLEELADAVFEMKKQFFEDLQTQKALGIAYANEEAIVRNINQLTDQVILKLIQDEYNAGKITTQRLAQIILRLIPEPQELRRLLPQIKGALMQVGMPHDNYLELIDKLKTELQNEELTRILEESSEAIGVDSEELIDELKRNPDQAAKLIYLASEINKGAGDELALADILVEYVEKMTTQAAAKAGEEGIDDDTHLRSVVNKVESTLLEQLGKLNVGDDVLARMESRINERMDSILDKMRVEWLNTQAGTTRQEKQKQLSVLQTLEHSVDEDEALSEILKLVRTKVETGDIEENNFSQIDAEITRQRSRLKNKEKTNEIPEGVLNSGELMFLLEKEIARANRYNAPFSALALSFVSATPKMKALREMVATDAIMAAALEKLAGTIREVDYIGQIGKNKMVAILPMIAYPAAKSALGRVMNMLHAKPLRVHDVPVELRVAGVAAEFKADQTPDARTFAKQLSNQLMDMVARIKNIQVLF